jgi:protein TonB
MIRHKNPAVNLKVQYNRVFAIALAISVLLNGSLFLVWREFKVEAYSKVREGPAVVIEDIPETRQTKAPPAPPRPAVPVVVEGEEVPLDETIGITDLDFDNIPINLPLPPDLGGLPQGTDEVTDEVVEFWHVEVEPKLVHSVQPVYPEVARKAGIEGMVILHLLVGKEGNVEEVKVLRGPEVFRQAAVSAAEQFRFSPALQNDKPVRVWVSQAIRFELQ